MSTHDELTAAADTVAGLRPSLATAARVEHLDWTVGFLRETAATAKREAAELDGLAAVMFAAVYPGTLYDAVLGVRWRDAARAAREHIADGSLRVGWTAPGQGHGVGDTFHLPTDWTTRAEPAHSSIPADATGLKGRRARVVGPMETATGIKPLGLEGGEVGTAATISCDTPDEDGDLHVRFGPGRAAWIAASSLALIPDGVVEEVVRCGGRYSDNSRCVLDDGHDSGCRYPFIPEPTAVVPEPPVGTRLRDRDGEVWEVRAGRLLRTIGLDYPYTLAELSANNGPLHQVWTDLDSIIIGTEYRDGNEVRRVRGAGDTAFPYGPFVAVEPYGAGQ